VFGCDIDLTSRIDQAFKLPAVNLLKARCVDLCSACIFAVLVYLLCRTLAWPIDELCYLMSTFARCSLLMTMTCRSPPAPNHG
jgi:hypothetical protein